MDLFANILSILSRGIIAVGGLVLVWNGVKTASALNDHNGPGIKDGLWGVGSGAVVILLGSVLTSITV